MSPTLPVPWEGEASHLLLLRDIHECQEKAVAYIVHLSLCVQLCEPISYFISPEDNIKRSGFKKYRDTLLEYGRTSAWCLPDDARKFFFPE